MSESVKFGGRSLCRGKISQIVRGAGWRALIGLFLIGVNLLVSASDFANQYWDGTSTVADGTIHGGSGTWDNVLTNWTNAGATVNTPWNQGVAIFEGTAGTVTLEDNIHFSGMEFMTGGYVIRAGGAQTLIAAPATTIDVDPGLTATISAPIVDGAGPAAIALTDSGTLILTGTNSYSGGTTIAAGTLQLGTAGTSGAITGIVTNNGVFNIVKTNGAGLTAIINNGNGVFEGAMTNFLNANTAGSGTITNTNGGVTEFLNTSTAGRTTITSDTGGGTVFENTSTAGGATIIDKSGGVTQFLSSSTAGSANVSADSGGVIQFYNTSSAGGAKLTVNSGGVIEFTNSSSAGSTTITTNSNGYTFFEGTSSGFRARIITNAGGTFDISALSSTGIGVGSIEGAGTYFLGSKMLTVGGNDLTTTVSGAIEDGGISGRAGGALTKVGAGVLTLTGANNYSGSTTIAAGTLQIGNGGTTGSIVTNVADNAALVFDRADTVAFAGAISGTGTLAQNGSGTLVLRGANTYRGNTNVNAGTLLVNGSLGTGRVTVASGATLGGTGTIGGPVTIQNSGTLAPGDAPGTLTMGTLTFNPGSISNYELGTPNVVGSGINDLVIVKGNLTLAGLLNVANAGGFGSGVYRLYNYTGSLTNDELTVNSVPAGFSPANFLVQTDAPGEVNLLVSRVAFTTQYWDGPHTVADGMIQGGTGTWDNVTTNWTNANGTVNAPWQNGFAVFEGVAGTVSLGANIQFIGMQFLSTGYTITARGAPDSDRGAVDDLPG
jgi:autotransporter-associated beta strand protein